MTDKKGWYLIQGKPALYAYGYLAGTEVYEITATIERLESGCWRWRLKEWVMQGIEPSSELAKQTAEEMIKQETCRPGYSTPGGLPGE